MAATDMTNIGDRLSFANISFPGNSRSIVDGLRSDPPPPVQTKTVTVTVTVTVPQVFTYKFRGFYPVTGQFEFWSSTNPNAATPTGHSLLDITQMSKSVES